MSEPPPAGLTLADAASVLAAQPFSVLLGTRLTRFHDTGATLELDLRPEHLQQNGFAHGGILAYLADNALTFAGGTALGPAILTGGLTLDYLRPAPADATLRADATVLHHTRRQAIRRCDIVAITTEDEAVPCAAAQGTIVAAQGRRTSPHPRRRRGAPLATTNDSTDGRRVADRWPTVHESTGRRTAPGRGAPAGSPPHVRRRTPVVLHCCRMLLRSRRARAWPPPPTPTGHVPDRDADRAGRSVSAATIDRRAMSRLSLGHGCADLCQGAVPALLPALIAHRGLSLTSATALVSIATIGSSVIQPLFGLWSDRLSTPRLAPIGVAIAALGLGAVGLCHSYLALAIALGVSGLGVALFHPEGARMAGAVGAGSARGMSYFSIGGNVGFALGPALVLLVLTIGGLNATPLLAVPGLIVAVLLAREIHRIAPMLPASRPPVRGAHGDRDTPGTGDARDHDGAPDRHRADPALLPAAWAPFTRLVSAAVARTVAFFALQAFVPLYLVQHLDTSDDLGTVALTLMLAAGAAGTLIGGRCADRYGRRIVLVWAMLPLTILLIALPHAGLPLFLLLLIGIGMTVDGPFSTTVVLGHEYLPGRTGLSSGITLGLAIGLGGLIATALGALADATSLHTAILTLPAFSALALLLALTLPDPPTPTEPARVSRGSAKTGLAHSVTVEIHSGAPSWTGCFATPSLHEGHPDEQPP